jgi:uncharacterized protein with FMN-binding domain
MRRALAALVVTAVAIVLLASYDTKPPTEFNPNSALRRPTQRTPVPIAATPTPRPHPPGTLTGKGPLITTPFSSIQVQAWVHEGKLIDVKTLYLTGNDAHTNALNARAEPILRREALEAGKAKVDSVSGATYTSEAWEGSLIAAVEAASVD